MKAVPSLSGGTALFLSDNTGSAATTHDTIINMSVLGWRALKG